MFILRLFKLAANKADFSRPELKSAKKIFMAEQCKPCEIYRTMYDVL